MTFVIEIQAFFKFFSKSLKQSATKKPNFCKIHIHFTLVCYNFAILNLRINFDEKNVFRPRLCDTYLAR